MKTLLLSAAIVITSSAAFARDQIRIVGSSTVFPYTQAVTEQFSNMGYSSPIVESTGTGGGFKEFCKGIGADTPDLTGASRAIKSSEAELCAKNGVVDISEALIGYDGIAISGSRDTEFNWDITLEELYLALATHVPVNGEWVANPYKNWNEINPNLPANPILVYGPPPTSGTRDAFVELVMHVGCANLTYVVEGGFDKDWIAENCSSMRQDGAFIEAGENDNLIVQRLDADVNALGIFGYSFLYENLDILSGVSIGGVAPTLDTIGDGSYPISRPLYIYVKNDHRGIIPGLQEFIEEYMSDDAISKDGYLSERGLVALSDEKLMEVQDRVINGK
jgi:phosphate transport system substrate-binding protein